ncbi:MAG: exodeoxyribonuclease V subunit gamma [Thermoanaerobaculia bacterium]|nr:exodeoxyribonuclease V subunit gamma [Thermoanaerobaculia bacterium]
MLTIYTSNGLDTLVERLSAEVSSAPLPPLEQEIVVVQSEGMQRWSTLELARRQGIAASLATPFPRPFCRWLALRVLDAVDLPLSEPISRNDDTVFGRELLSWRLFGLLGDLAEDEALGGSAPADYLADDPDQRKRFQLSQRLGWLFDDYQLFRPDLLDGWERDGGTGETALETETWQAELWRRLVRSADGEEPFSRRLMQLTRHLGTAKEEPAGLPKRLWVLGVSTLPPAFVRVLVAISRWRPVGIFFVSPTYHYWADLRSDREQASLRRRMRLDTARGDLPHLERGNALLAALGRQGREFFEILQRADPSGSAWHELDFHDPAEVARRESGGSDDSGERVPTLARLQSDILHLVDRGDPEGPGPVAWPADAHRDESLEIHACHAPTREMEVLKDRLLHAFASDETLRPSDVLVMVPDIELYGPYIQAVFGARAGEGPEIPFSIADRRAGREQPPSEAILDVLDLVNSRATVRQVLDLLDTPAVARRFAITSIELPILRRMTEETRIRWGFDAEHRRRIFDVPLEQQNTWRAGLDRLIMGYATGDTGELVDTPDGSVLPFSGDTAGAAELLGRFAGYVETLSSVLESLRHRRSFGEWADELLLVLERLFSPQSEDEERGLQAIRDAADELRQLSEVVGRRSPGRSPTESSAEPHVDPEADEPIHLQVVREHLGAVLSTAGFASGFLAGKVTFCALRPMRTIPFGVVAIGGLDEGAFPRRDRRQELDLMARARRRGDRSIRDDDRYLFLETLLAARSRLILSYVGFSPQDATPREPSAVLSELLDQVDRTFVCADGRPARDKVLVAHPLQPWSWRYFAGGESVLRSYDAVQLRAAEALRAGGGDSSPFAASALPRGGESEVDLTVDELVRFWTHPIREFCRRLGIVLESEEDGSDDAEPFTVTGLDGFAIRQWLLEGRLEARRTGEEDHKVREASERAFLRAWGALPPGRLGDAAWNELSRRVDELLIRIPDESELQPASIDVRGDIGSAETSWRLGGRIGQRTVRGLLHYRCAGVRAADRLRTWIEHLAVTASTGSRESARLLGESRELVFDPPTDAIALLGSLVDGYLHGLRRPLPLTAETSLAWAEQARALSDPRRRLSRSPREAARQVFEGRHRIGGALAPESRDPYVRLCFRDLDLLDHPEAGRWAERLWRPVFDHHREVA